MRKPFVKSRILTPTELEHVRGNPNSAFKVGAPVPKGHPGLHFTGQAALGLATTQPKKFLEMILPLSTRTENVKIVNAIEWLGWWLSADEISRSYLGNAYEKAQSLMDRIYDHLGYDKFMAGMKERGLNGENFAFIVNDTGSSLETDYSAEPEFNDSRKEVTPGSWPGVETGPIFDAHMGVGGFHSALKKLKSRLKKEGRKLNQSGWDEVTYLMFKPTPSIEDVKIFCFEARVPIRFHTKLGKTAPEILKSHDFLSLDMQDVPKEYHAKRISEFRKEYLSRFSPMALATNAMIGHMDVPRRLSSVFARHTAEPTPYVVATQANLIPAQGGEHRKNLPDNAVYQTTHYDYEENGAVDDFCHHADGIMLTPHSAAVLKDWDNHVLDLTDLWCSVIVNNQVNVEQSFGKPLVVLNDKKSFTCREAFNGTLDWDDPDVEKAFVEFLGEIDPASDPWLKFTMMTKFLHEKNFVKQEPGFLFHQRPPTDIDLGDELMTMMEEGRQSRIHPPKYEAEYFGADRTDLFEISVFGSAGTRVDEYVRDAENLGYWAASQAMHVRTGGGNYGIMGAASRGVLRYMGEFSSRPGQCHLSAIQMPRTLQFEGACLNPKNLKGETNKFMAIERNFDDRMTSLFRSDLSVVLSPGIGTYQEAVRWLRHKRDGAPHLQDQKLVLVNSKQPGSQDGIRLMDPFLKILPDFVLKNDIVVVPTVEDAKRIALEVQRRHAPPSAPAVSHLRVVR